MKVYYSFEGESYTFKFFYQDILVVSGIRIDGRMFGNKRKSIKINIIFMKSYLFNSTGKTKRKPELNLWDEYLESFWISKEELLKWINKYTKINFYYFKIMEELKNKIEGTY